MSDEITLQESSRLIELERKIERGLTTFVEVGEALAEIRDSKLYRIEHKTFEAYCRDKWKMSQIHAWRIIESASVTKTLPMGKVSPSSERQVRPLTKLGPEQQPVAWERAVEIADGGQPTAKQVEQAVVEVLEPEESHNEEQPSEGLRLVDQAIRILSRIAHNDRERKQAIRRLEAWISINK